MPRASARRWISWVVGSDAPLPRGSSAVYPYSNPDCIATV